jgi:hypothetical protein
MNENDLINKLLISKKIMEKHNEIPRAGNTNLGLSSPTVDDYQAPQAKYNLPDNVMLESAPKKQIDSSQINSKDKILNSKLPDEIKRLMIEHPIHQPKQSTSTLSNDLIDKAARLMNVDASGKKTAPLSQKEQFSDSTNLKELIKESLREILSEEGLIVESVKKSNDIFSFKVGKHLFEGKVTKIKKLL